ncbi:reverse transcriptase domain-containing protein, partial [Tanacetum coccineum]
MKSNLQDQANDPALWDVLKRKFEKSCSDDDFHSQRHDDHQEDDAPPRGKTRQQHQQQEWDAWEEETVIDEDEVIPEDETPELIIEFQNVDKRIQTIFDRARIKATLNDMLSNQITKVVRIPADQLYGLDFMEQIIVIRENDKPDSFSEADFKYLNKIDIEDFISARTNEKRVMYLVEIVKFCDATLERVLNEVKLRIFQNQFWKKPPRLGELDLDIMKAFEREISKRLRHRQQMRRTYKIKTIQKEVVKIESLKSSTQHSSINEFVFINIPKEDLKTKQIILDLDDQPMWKSFKTVAPTPNSAIIQIDVDDNFVINSTHLKMIRENKFDGYLRADPHDHIREFLAICDMFKYGETQSEAVKLLIFPLSLCDKAKTWFNELNEESITSWEQMRRAFINRFFPPSLFNRLLLEIRSFSQNVCESLTDAWLRLKNMLQKCHGHGLTKGAIIQIFYHGLDEPTQGILDGTAGGIFLYKSPNQAFQFLEDKVLFKLDWSTKSQNEHHQKSVAFADGSNSNNDNSRLMEKLEALTIKMDSQFIRLNKELQDMRNKYYELRDDHASKNHMNDDTPIYFKRCIRSMRTVHDKLFDRNDQSKTDFEKSITKFLDSQRVTNMFFKNNVNDMILKMKQNEKNFQTKIKNMERKIDEWSKSQNVSSEQTDITDPPPPQAQTEHVNAVFTGSGKSDDSLKIQKDPPPIIVNNKSEKDRPIKTTKKGYHIVKTNEYSF